MVGYWVFYLRERGSLVQGFLVVVVARSRYQCDTNAELCIAVNAETNVFWRQWLRLLRSNATMLLKGALRV